LDNAERSETSITIHINSDTNPDNQTSIRVTENEIDITSDSQEEDIVNLINYVYSLAVDSIDEVVEEVNKGFASKKVYNFISCQ